MTATTIELLERSRALTGSADARLSTSTDHEWLTSPEDLRTDDVMTYGDDSADLVLSTNGLSR